MTTPTTPPVSIEDFLTVRATRVVTAKVLDCSADVAVCELADGSMARLPVTEFYPNRIWEQGRSYQLAAFEGQPPRLSAVVDELIPLLLEGLCPEIRDGSVRVMDVTRQVGIRSKVSVAATREGVDPVGACLGRAANRIKALSAMLLGERVDVVSYHPDPQRYLLNALAVAPISVEVDEEQTVKVVVPRHQLSAAIGGGNLNVVLASRLVGRKVQVIGG